MNSLFPLKPFFSMLTFATFGLLAGSAFAQNSDYKRGYDQGYRDAIEASREHRGPSEPMRRLIHILDARYGFHGQVCDAHHAVEEIVGMRRHADVKASNDLCGDPASGRVKRLSIVYRCGDGPELRVAGAEGTVLALGCR